MMRGRKPEWQKRIARERIEKLFRLADEAASHDISLSDRYVEIAKKIGMRYLVRIPKRLKIRMCKYCGGFLKPGVSASVRVAAGSNMLKITCWRCGKTIKRSMPDKNVKG